MLQILMAITPQKNKDQEPHRQFWVVEGSFLNNICLLRKPNFKVLRIDCPIQMGVDFITSM